MKKAILLLLSLCLVLSLCACGDKDEEESPAQSENNIFSDEESGEASSSEPLETPEPTPPPIPSIDPQWSLCRGTWVSKPSEDIASSMDAYFDDPNNYLYLSPDTRGAIVLGGWYREFLYTADEKSISLKFSDNGEEWSGDIIKGSFTGISDDDEDFEYTIYELAPGGAELHYTFIYTPSPD